MSEVEGHECIVTREGGYGFVVRACQCGAGPFLNDDLHAEHAEAASRV